VNDVLELLDISAGDACIDMTVGPGGHSAAVLEASAPNGRLLGIDRDAGVLECARTRLAGFGDRVRLVHCPFADVAVPAAEFGFTAVQAVLFDLGISSWQLDAPGRGFGFKHDMPLDMRMNTAGDVTAADILNTWPEQALADILKEYGNERLAKPVARAVCRRREKQPFRMTAELAGLVSGVYKRFGWRRSRMHPATKTFQALRMAVNDELEQLRAGLEAGMGLLAPGGRMAVISFHSGEDRIVKHFFKREAAEHRGVRITRKPVKAGDDEIQQNPRARSALLRVFEKGAVQE
jgi:16S rRNA (cytosine1402-N4)-methyltransferase